MELISTNVTYASAWGDRKYQEDRLLVERIDFGEGQADLLAVMDGHAGDQASEYIRRVMPRVLSEVCVELPPSNDSGWKEALRHTVARLHEQTEAMEAGSTLSAVLVPVEQTKAYVAIVGDSPVIIKDASGAVHRSPEHNARTNDAERDAAIERGAFYDGAYLHDLRTGHGLQLSRSLGDAACAGFLSREPEVYDVEVGHGGFIIVASDGLLDPGHDEAVEQEDRLVAMVAEGAEADILVEDALRRETGDNVSAVVYRFA